MHKTFSVLEPISSEFDLRDTQHESEFDVQSYIRESLSSLGFAVRGEVKRHISKREVCRFDIVIFKPNGDAAAIIECKRDGKTACIGHTRQGKRYTHFGVPVITCSGMDGANRAVNYILERFSLIR